MAFALALIGGVLILTCVGGLTGEAVVRAGHNDIPRKMRPKALDDMAVFVEALYRLKLGHR